MIDILIKILAPLFSKLGVSSADLSSYMYMISKYIYTLLFLIIVFVACFIRAGFGINKEKRLLFRGSAFIVFILLVTITINAVCFGPLYSNIAGVMNASKIELSSDVVEDSKKIIKQVGEEGIVLVKNTGLLPLSSDVSKLNVFGWASVNPIYGGVGSGASDSSDSVSILESLQNAGYETNADLSEMYLKYRSDRPEITIKAQDWTLPEPTADYYTGEIMDKAQSFSDTALIVIGRSGGEGADLPTDMKAVIDGTYDVRLQGVIEESVADNYCYTNASYINNGAYDDFDVGETYLELSNTEEYMIDTVCNVFSNVIIVINAANSMELSWVDKYENIGAVLLVPGTGATGMEALGEIIRGSINPSGKTVDTFVKDLTNTPAFNNVGNFSYSNVNDIKQKIAAKDASYEGNLAFVNYTEGIYVGYKFYETAADDGVIQYDDYVQYPFGFGLSYTTFTQEITSFKQNKDSIKLSIKVENTGNAAGKDVIEIYSTPPYINGGIEKSSVNLVDFEKTDSIEPGEIQEINVEIPLQDLASYDYQCLKTSDGGYVLEAGEYCISLRSDSHTILTQKTFSLNDDIVYEDGKADDKNTVSNKFSDCRGDFAVLSRADGFANLDGIVSGPSSEQYVLTADLIEKVLSNTVVGYNPKSGDVDSDEKPLSGQEASLALEEMTRKSYEDDSWEQMLDELTVEEMINLINVGGWQTVEIESIGKVATNDCDGPAGLSNFITKNYGTAFPSEVLMAQTWSKDVADKIGNVMGQEFANAENYGWYGPAMNIHRSAFSGRNFEYYSEDSVLSGKFASMQVNCAAKWGVYPYIKHFALNDQETNRESILLTFADEQTIRETYLKPFEMVVKAFDFDNYVMAVMSAYNWIGATPACANSNLLNDVLRGEWGFVGMVISDYDGSYGYMISDACIRNGNDLMLGFGNADSNRFTDRDSATLQLAMRNACKNILYTVANSGYYKDAEAIETGGFNNLEKTFVMIDSIVIIICIMALALLIVHYKRKMHS